MLLLALDTSTRQSSIALCSEDEFYGEASWYSSNNHSVEILSAMQRLLAESSKTLQDLDAVAVATGPGSFNGVRVALAAAKALAFALAKPVLGVSTLDIIAKQQQLWRGPICSVLEAGRGELYAACYLSGESSQDGSLLYHLNQVGPYFIGPPEQLVAHLQTHVAGHLLSQEQPSHPVLFCGEIGAASRQALYEQLSERCVFVGSVQSVRRATNLALLALQRFHAGQRDDPRTLEPLYLRRPSITTSTRKQPLLGGINQRPTGQHTTEREEGALRH